MVTSLGWILALFVALSVPPHGAAAGDRPAALQQTEGQNVEKVDINKASAEELQKVPGIGPALAARIIEFRDEHGPFERLEDLLDVRGIGVRTLERLRPYLKIDEAGTAGGPSPRLP